MGTPCECPDGHRGRRPWHVQTLLVGEPGDLTSGRPAIAGDGPHRDGEGPKPMMHGREKSAPAMVALNPTNNAEAAGAADTVEPVEPRAGNAG